MVGVIEDVAEVARWAKGIEGVHECIAGRFRRPEPRRRALDYLRGLLSPVERKNGWQLAEQAGDATPYGVQHLLSTCVWDADLVRDDLRDYVVEHLGDVHGVLVVDETGFLKKGNKSVGVQRQYSGTAGRIENCQIGVFLTYASAQGRTLLDRELYLPRVWADDLERRREAGVPEKAAFRTKPQLARRMLERALESGVPFGWVTGDEVYGNDRNLRLWLERRDVPHVLAVRSNEKPWAETDRGWRQVRADRLAPGVEEPGWVRCSAGDGAKGPRVYDWARVEIRPLKEPGKGYWLLVRRSIAKPGELAYYVCFGPVDTTLEELVRVAGTRWTLVGPSKNALRRPRERWVWTSMKSGNGMAGTGTSPWRCWPTPAWRWSGARRWNQEVREKRGLSQLGRKADTPDGARGPAVALPADMETSTYGRISAAVVPVETAAPGNGPALPLPTPPETPHHISATVVLNQYQGGMCISGVLKTTPRTPRHLIMTFRPRIGVHRQCGLVICTFHLGFSLVTSTTTGSEAAGAAGAAASPQATIANSKTIARGANVNLPMTNPPILSWIRAQPLKSCNFYCLGQGNEDMNPANHLHTLQN